MSVTAIRIATRFAAGCVRTVTTGSRGKFAGGPRSALESVYRERIAAAREAAEDDPRLADEAQQLEEDAPDRVCRLKYRTKNGAGQEITRDELFLLQSGKARLLAGDSSLAIAARKAFADGEERP